MSTSLTVVTQREGIDPGAPWILDRAGQRTLGHDNSRRTARLEQGLLRHERASSKPAECSDDTLASVLRSLHDPTYLDALAAVDWTEPRMTPEWGPPGIPADSPVWAGVVVSAFESARTSIAAAECISAGQRFAYSVSRPPGHHAGPAWMGGYCYLNTAACAAMVLRDRGLAPVTILDIDFHFPTGTAALANQMSAVDLCSLHASTIDNVPWRPITAGCHERFVEFTHEPGAREYMTALSHSLTALRKTSASIVLSLGYDTIRGDPHGAWRFSPELFNEIGKAIGAVDLPVCVVQEGGYALDSLATCSYEFARGLLGEV